MWPNIGPVKLWTICYVLGIFSFACVCFAHGRRLSLRTRAAVILSLLFLFGMTVGAKILWDLQHGPFSFFALFDISHYLRKGMWGGVLAFLGLAVPGTLLLAENKPDTLDAIALSLPIPLFLAKLGCLLNGCCHGIETSVPWAITFPEGAYTAPPGVPTHPTQAYEMVVVLGIYVLFRKLDRARWRGTLLLWFLLVYGLGRAATEIFRADLAERGLVLGAVSLSQVLCVAAACISAIVLARFHKTRPAMP